MRIVRNSFIAAICILSLTGCKGDVATNEDKTSSPATESMEPPQTLAPKAPPANERPETLSEADLELCFSITSGKTLVSDLPLQGEARNSFYLECALQPFIGEADAAISQYEGAKAAQLKNSAYLFMEDIDPQHVCQGNGRLLFMVIWSMLADEDKIAWLARLVDEGADVNFMNEYGNEALRAAEFSEQPEIHAWLIEQGARPKP